MAKQNKATTTTTIDMSQGTKPVAFQCPASLHREAKMFCLSTDQKLGSFMVDAIAAALAAAKSGKATKAA